MAQGLMQIAPAQIVSILVPFELIARSTSDYRTD
jgi:hypothetical protein